MACFCYSLCLRIDTFTIWRNAYHPTHQACLACSSDLNVIAAFALVSELERPLSCGSIHPSMNLRSWHGEPRFFLVYFNCLYPAWSFCSRCPGERTYVCLNINHLTHVYRGSDWLKFQNKYTFKIVMEGALDVHPTWILLVLCKHFTEIVPSVRFRLKGRVLR